MVSIIIPAYNVAKYIPQCIESCIAQTYHDIEIIIINDGSTDTTLDIITSYARSDNRMKVIDQPNQGVVCARQKGVVAASGEWILFVDGDDYIAPDMVESMLSYTVSESSQIVVCDFAYIKSSGKKVVRNQIPPVITRESIAEYFLEERIKMSLWGKLFKTELFDNIKTVESLKIGEDGYWCFQLLIKAAPDISLLHEPFYNYVEHPNSTIRSHNNLTNDTRLQLIDEMERLVTDNFIPIPARLKDSLIRFETDQYFGYLSMGGDWNTIASKATNIFDSFLRQDRLFHNHINTILIYLIASRQHWGIKIFKAYLGLKDLARKIVTKL